MDQATLAGFLQNAACTANIRLFARLAYALSDESRVRSVLALGGGELCVCKITAMLGLAPSTVSKHMSILRDAGLVQSRKEGRWIYFRRPENSRNPVVRQTLKLLSLCTKGDPQIETDSKKLKKIGCTIPSKSSRRNQ
jgi:ArsR family transcriptional regulator, arsenate/arsenite/antimonite-responsive transcriptional repressor